MFSITLYTKQLGVRENNALYFFMRGSILNSLVNFAVCLDLRMFFAVGCHHYCFSSQLKYFTVPSQCAHNVVLASKRRRFNVTDVV